MEDSSGQSARRTFYLARFLLLLVPIINFIGYFNYFTYGLSHSNEHRRFLSPSRCLFSLLAPLFIARQGLKKRSLDRSGAIAGIAIGFILTLSNVCFFFSLLAFFITGTKVTKFRAHLKREFEDGYKEGGERNWIQVICTAGVAANVAVLFVIETGCGEYAIDFSKSFTIAWLCTSVLGVLATSNGDTFASEIGSVLGSSQPRLITTLESVPIGTNGAISFIGLLASAMGGAIVGMAYYAGILICISRDTLEGSPVQWPIILVGAATGLIGSLVDSLIGAWLQYSGKHKVTGKIVEYPGPEVEDICGNACLDNHGVNLVTTIVMAFMSPSIAISIWSFFT